MIDVEKIEKLDLDTAKGNKADGVNKPDTSRANKKNTNKVNKLNIEIKDEKNRIERKMQIQT